MVKACIHISFNKGTKDYLIIQIIDVTDINRLDARKSFRIEKLMTYCPKGLNVREKT